MSLRKLLAHFGFARQLPTQRDPDLARTKGKHKRAITKADRVLDRVAEDYRRGDAVIELRVVRRSR